ncbi:hypothetical protein [Olivibacter ginsenosidimutans]|uniref:hypothetical protein n=1 Tax=Olivibacter ginsenosidimutans TaxID=1176537 RepID=UPI0031F13139
MLTTNDFILLPLEHHGFSPAFLKCCKAHHFYTLKDVIDLGAKHIIQSPAFTAGFFDELSSFLQQHRLLYLLDLADRQ